MRGRTHSNGNSNSHSQRQLNTMNPTTLGISLPGVFFYPLIGRKEARDGKSYHRP